MRERIPTSAIIGAARLDHFQLLWNKPGVDGSGKANIRPTANSVVWGVVYRIEAHEWPRLDAFEPGYTRTSVGVLHEDELVPCVTYCAPGAPDAQPPYDWYRNLVIEGARDHGLPADYVRHIEAVPIQPDAKR